MDTALATTLASSK